MTAETADMGPAASGVDGTSPPHNIEAEQAFLGALLFENEVFHRVADWLRPEHFYDPFHARLYAAASQLITSGALADAVVLKNRLGDDEGLKELGGPVYLVELMREAPEALSAPEYARLVYELALRRQLIDIGSRISADARDTRKAAAANALIEQAERELFSLAESGTVSKSFQPFSTALAQSVEVAAAAYKRGGKLSGIPSGLNTLDAKLGGLHRSDLIILAGRPSMGKTALATNIAFSVARAHRYEEAADGTRRTVEGGVVGFFSLEMSAEQLATRLIADYTGISGYFIRQGRIDAAQFAEINDAVREINDIPLYIDDTGGISIGALTARARRLKRMHGLDVLVIDYLQLVTGSSSRRSESRVQEISEITQALKALAKELDIPVIALSQLSRQVEQRDDKKPQLSDLRESGSIEQDADVVMFVYREAYYLERAEPKEGTEEHLRWEDEMREIRNRAEVIIGKQRHGPIGAVKVAFDPERTKFSDLEDTGRYSSLE
ncbi:MAG: replicative DNA helicase [Oceanicaulis sp.]|uniref:replicative DNA helicase n=1 Tax=Glycocaulis sp. TaxID=1969725 RepID=UPI0025C042CA|nr:replicative DNA helicase [Glycocaulis sp.]MCC5981119.1 replicative DNA helicase [Oceanicaulis sp.]MCH8521874.1 replicative DNA helicase [Glycocaulis sp.]